MTFALLGLSTSWAARAPDALPRILRVPFDPATVIVVPTHPDVTTQVQAPLGIDAWQGFGFTEDLTGPDAQAGDFFIDLRPGEPFLGVRPLAEGVSRNLFLLIGGTSYPIEFTAAARRENALLKVILVPEETAIGSRAAAPTPPSSSAFRVRRSRSLPPVTTRPAHPETHLGLITVMRSLAGLTRERAETFVQGTPDLALSYPDLSDQDHGSHSLRLHFVVRQESTDTLGFCVSVRNEEKQVLSFEPNGFFVRAGTEVLTSAGADWKPTLAPGETEVAFFVVTRTADGRRNLLDPSTPWRIFATVLPTAIPAERPVENLDVPWRISP